MLTEDTETQTSMSALIAEARLATRPWLFWIGAGPSRWCGYPGWGDFADALHSEYSRSFPSYNQAKAVALLAEANYPAIFQLCQDTHSQTYFKRLSETFEVRRPNGVYDRFIRTLSAFEPVRVITTNIDEMLEKHLPQAATIGRRDLERAIDLLTTKTSFVCKVHGTVSDIETAVFTSSDYDRLLSFPGWLANLGRLLAQTSVVFIGYGLRDEYLLGLLAKNCDLKRLFGDGPHFAVVTPEFNVRLPANVRVIRYEAGLQTDHRTAISVIEELHSEIIANQPSVHKHSGPSQHQSPLRSAHLLFDVSLPGTWESSQTFEARGRDDGKKIEVIIGPGFINAELGEQQATAMHDLVVGLLCFDTVVFSIGIISKVHDLVGGERFWRLFDEGVFEFLNWTHQPALIYPDPGAATGGTIGSILIHGPDMKVKGTADAIRRQLKPVPGREVIAEQQLDNLEKKTRTITDEEEASIPATVRSILLRPSVRRLLGMSEGTPITSIPKWQTFPVLRLAQVARIGAACRLLGIPSAKLDFGTSALAAPVFASTPGKEWADDVASYVICGVFAADLGARVLSNPGILDSVLAFRETARGRSLRSEILSYLAASEGAEVPVAVNSALSATIPPEILQTARDEFIRLSAPQGAATISKVVLWTDKRAEDAISAWRNRSKATLEQYLKKLGIGPYDFCPCGSGEKLKFCCAEALSN
jgi:hypothetical protein